MKLAHKIATVVVLSVALVPLGSTAASASPAGDLQDAYCDVLEALGYTHVQDCRFIDN